MGNSAFRDDRFDDAITFYTQAISKDDQQYVCYSNRSAAYLRKGELVNALEDAGRCIAINPSYHKGHIRRVAVYHEMEEYEDAIDAYREGLEHCPDDKTLQRGLKEAIRRLRQQEEAGNDEEKVLQTFKF